MQRKELESQLERQVCDYAEATGWFCLKIMRASKRAAMDRVFIKDGVHLWVEMKREGEDLRRQQELRAKEMRDHGAICLKWDNFERAKYDLDFYSL